MLLLFHNMPPALLTNQQGTSVTNNPLNLSTENNTAQIDSENNSTRVNPSNPSDQSLSNVNILVTTRVEPRLTYWNPESRPISIVHFAVTEISFREADIKVLVESNSENNVVKFTFSHMGSFRTINVSNLEHSSQNF